MTFMTWILSLPPFVVVIIVSFLISLFITIMYKLLTDQTVMKSLKDRLKQSQDEMKKSRDDPAKLMKIQKKAMEANMEYMMKSLRPTLFTFLPIILVFGWMNANFAYNPILPDHEFSATLQFVDGVSGDVQIITPSGILVLDSAVQTIVDNAVSWRLMGDAGEYLIKYHYGENDYESKILIDQRKGRNPVTQLKNSAVKSVTLSNTPMIIIQIFGLKMSWLWVYILSSVIFSMVMRKSLGIY